MLLVVFASFAAVSGSQFEQKLAAELHKDLSPYLKANDIGFWFGETP
jgi:hypothetical protein